MPRSMGFQPVYIQTIEIYTAQRLQSQFNYLNIKDFSTQDSHGIDTNFCLIRDENQKALF
jgi:hypothetical protein